MKPSPSEHYSYTFYADPSTAANFDTWRFSGPIGELVAASQADVLTRFVGEVTGRTLLDVGTGTGRGALLLAGLGAEVTGVDASNEMLAVARQRAAERGIRATFQVGDAHHLEFPDRSFDIAVSLRVLMHTPAWREAVLELCRVATHLVVFDYPSAHSAAAVQSVARRVLHAFGAAKEPYRVFTDGQMRAALEAGGFRIRAVDRQFVLPIAVHKAIGVAGFTRGIERVLGRAGLNRLFGSPVTVVAERCASS